MKINTKKVFVGISGGVDSSVVAYLLKKKGYDVHGIFVKTWSPEWLPCTWVDEKRDAMRVCAALDIPFHYLDAEEEYKKGVAEYMIAEYKIGRTPNPDVLCNRIIKFSAMWEYAKAQGAEVLATGHYARTDGIHLFKGNDVAKDQSYFLWMISKEELRHIYFPIGDFKKEKVRSIAKEANLFTGEKKDSQGICFLGDVDMKEFLKHYIEEKKGPVVLRDGTVVGEHDGVFFLTLGQRHGFRLFTQNTDQKPYYVVEKKYDTNTIVVDTNPFLEKESGGVKKITLRNYSWLETINGEKKYTAQIRYHGEFIPATIKSEKAVEISYTGPIALGQSLVMYDRDVVVGGGVIDHLE